MAKIKIQCPKCQGSGLYTMHTHYTVAGVPVCFKCKGAGFLMVTPASYPASGPHTKLAKVKYADTGRTKLVDAKIKNKYVWFEFPQKANIDDFADFNAADLAK